MNALYDKYICYGIPCYCLFSVGSVCDDLLWWQDVKPLFKYFSVAQYWVNLCLKAFHTTFWVNGKGEIFIKIIC